MFEKNGKFYADWRDRSGKRLRKSFTSKRAAFQFEAEQKEVAHPKLRALGSQSRKFSAPPIQKTPSTVARPVSSSRLQVVASRASSRPRTPSRSTTR